MYFAKTLKPCLIYAENPFPVWVLSKCKEQRKESE